MSTLVLMLLFDTPALLMLLSARTFLLDMMI